MFKTIRKAAKEFKQSDDTNKWRRDRSVERRDRSTERQQEGYETPKNKAGKKRGVKSSRSLPLDLKVFGRRSTTSQDGRSRDGGRSREGGRSRGGGRSRSREGARRYTHDDDDNSSSESSEEFVASRQKSPGRMKGRIAPQRRKNTGDPHPEPPQKRPPVRLLYLPDESSDVSSLEDGSGIRVRRGPPPPIIRRQNQHRRTGENSKGGQNGRTTKENSDTRSLPTDLIVDKSQVETVDSDLDSVGAAVEELHESAISMFPSQKPESKNKNSNNRPDLVSPRASSKRPAHSKSPNVKRRSTDGLNRSRPSEPSPGHGKSKPKAKPTVAASRPATDNKTPSSAPRNRAGMNGRGIAASKSLPLPLVKPMRVETVDSDVESSTEASESAMSLFPSERAAPGIRADMPGNTAANAAKPTPLNRSATTDAVYSSQFSSGVGRRAAPKRRGVGASKSMPLGSMVPVKVETVDSDSDYENSRGSARSALSLFPDDKSNPDLRPDLKPLKRETSGGNQSGQGGRGISATKSMPMPTRSPVVERMTFSSKQPYWEQQTQKKTATATTTKKNQKQQQRRQSRHVSDDEKSVENKKHRSTGDLGQFVYGTEKPRKAKQRFSASAGPRDFNADSDLESDSSGEEFDIEPTPVKRGKRGSKKKATTTTPTTSASRAEPAPSSYPTFNPKFNKTTILPTASRIGLTTTKPTAASTKKPEVKAEPSESSEESYFEEIEERRASLKGKFSSPKGTAKNASKKNTVKNNKAHDGEGRDSTEKKSTVKNGSKAERVPKVPAKKVAKKVVSEGSSNAPKSPSSAKKGKVNGKNLSDGMRKKRPGRKRDQDPTLSDHESDGAGSGKHRKNTSPRTSTGRKPPTSSKGQHNDEDSAQKKKSPTTDNPTKKPASFKFSSRPSAASDIPIKPSSFSSRRSTSSAEANSKPSSFKKVTSKQSNGTETTGGTGGSSSSKPTPIKKIPRNVSGGLTNPKSPVSKKKPVKKKPTDPIRSGGGGGIAVKKKVVRS